MSVSSRISDNVKFVYETFPVPPSMRAIIEVNVYHPVYGYYHQNVNSEHFPILGIYTQNHMNIKNQCTHTKYGQLLNFNLHPGITLDTHHSKPLKCAIDDFSNKIHCTGNITVQDFKPRHFSFSFGFHCNAGCLKCSIKGLVYKLRIYSQTNETKCVTLPPDSAKRCKRYSRYGICPNLVGNMNLKEISISLFDIM